MIRGAKDGIYPLPDTTDYIPPVPEDKFTRKNQNFDESGARIRLPLKNIK
jgi:hypothetical protein